MMERRAAGLARPSAEMRFWPPRQSQTLAPQMAAAEAVVKDHRAKQSDKQRCRKAAEARREELHREAKAKKERRVTIQTAPTIIAPPPPPPPPLKRSASPEMESGEEMEYPWVEDETERWNLWMAIRAKSFGLPIPCCPP